MEPLTLIGLFSAVGPFIMPPLKRLLGTTHIESDQIRGTVHEALLLLLGLAASIINEYTHQGANPNWLRAVVVGLANGAGASFVRNADKNVIGVAEGLYNVVVLKKPALPTSAALTDGQSIKDETKS